jgi:hypothetical protein
MQRGTSAADKEKQIALEIKKLREAKGQLKFVLPLGVHFTA